MKQDISCRERIFDCVAEALGHRAFSADTDLMEAGLTSVGKTMKLLSALSETFDTALTIRDLRENPTVEALDAFLSDHRTQETYEIKSDYPLMQNQKGILTESLSNPDTTIYNLPMYARLPDQADLQRLKSAVETVVDAHPYLKMTLFTDDGGEFRARRNDESRPVVQIVNCEAFPEPNELIRPFRMLDAPLYRVTLYHTREGNYLFWDFHHILCDAESERIFLNDVAAAYEGKTVEPETFTAFDAALTEEEERQSDLYGKAKAYYEKAFGGLDANCLPTPDLKGKNPGSGFLKAPSAIAPAAVKEWCKQHGTAPNSFYSALFGFVVSRYGFSDESVFTTIYNGRNDSRVFRAIGMFVKTLPVCCRVSKDLSVSDYIHAAERQIYDSIGNDIYSFAEVSEGCGIRPELSLGYQPRLSMPLVLDGNACEAVWMPLDTAKFPLSVDVQVNEDKTVYSAEYHSDLYSEDFVRGFLGAMDQAACDFLNKQELNRVSLCSPAQEEQIRNWNETDVPVEPVNVCRLFEAQVDAHPDRPAVIARERTVTYGELNQKANCIAHALIRRGLRPEETVGILLPRTEEAVAAEYGIMKAGGAFLPMLPDYPDDRIDYCMTDSDSRFVLTTDEFIRERQNLFAGKSYTAFSVQALLQEEGGGNPCLEIPAGALAYCIYTSGSTGKPKGVMIEHGNLCNFVNANERNHESFQYVSHGTTALSVAALSFDFSLMEIHLTLLNGMTLCIADEEAIQNPLRLAELIRRNHVDVISGTPSFLSNLLDIPEAAQALDGVKLYDLGAEAFPPSLYEKLRKASPDSVIVNGYGPTEATISCISKVITDVDSITIGKPAANVKAWIFDRFGNLLPPFARGELLIGGLGVGRGYINLPEKTAEVFLRVEGHRAYRTGDVARYNGSGEIEFFGRLDNQVKLHGLRIELDEIEAVMGSYPGLRQGVVLVRENEKGEGYLCAYFTADAQISISDLKAHLAKRLARYMVPAAFVQMETIPMTQNGKVDRKALPEPVLRQAEIVPPRNGTQQKIFDCLAEVLGHRGFGITTDIYDAGLTSLGAIRLTVLLFKAFNIPVAARDLKDNETVEKLEAFLSAQKKQESYTLREFYPLTRTQSGILAESLSHPDTTIYNIPMLFRLSDRVDLRRLKTAIQAAAAAHPYLNATLTADEQGNFMVRRDDGSAPAVEMIKTNRLPENLVKPFDLMGEKLCRMRIYETDEGNYLFLDCHHIAFDGTSAVVLLRDINAAYAGETVETEDYTGFEIALDEEALRKTSQYAKARAYYETLLSDLDRDILPKGDVYRDAPHNGSFIKESNLDQSAVTAWCGENHVTENAFYNAVFAFVLAKYNYRNEALYTTIYNGRQDSRMERAVTMLVKTLPVACRFDGGETVADFIRSVGEQLMDSMASDIFSFAEICESFDMTSDIMFAYQGDNFVQDSIGGEPAQECPLPSGEVKAALNVIISVQDGRVSFMCEHYADRYSRAFMEGMLACMERTAEEFMNRDTLREVTLLDPAAKEQLDAFNATDVEIPYTTCNRLFEAQVRLHPDKTAVIADGVSLTYSQLNESANRVGNALMADGVRPDDMVAVMMPRVVWAYAAREGILKAGGAYMPVAPDYPDERVAYILENSGAKFIVTTEELANARAELFERAGVAARTMETLLAHENTADPDPDISPENLCYCIYTSGSTGKPKGVMIEHHSLVNFVDHNPVNLQSCEFVDNMSVSLALAALTFDVSVLEETLGLYHGGTVAMATEEEINNPLQLCEMMKRTGVDVMKCTPSYMNNLLDIPETLEVLRQMKAIDIGAEAFPAPLYDKMRAAGITAKIHNGYGPTETTITASMDALTDHHITIGKPLCNTRLVIVDRFGHEMPPDVPGELMITGACVGRGYVANEKLTREKFVTWEGRPAYHSGDLARWNRDGKVVFMGRMDNQVKLHGLRIELDEIENVLNAYPAVRRSVVVVRKPETGDEFLCAYYTADTPVDPSELKAHLSKSLAKYMVPAAFVQMEAIPMTQNGKVDKKALPEPVLQQAEIVPPRNGTQERIFDCVAEVLGHRSFGITTDIYDAGLTSLGAIRLTVLLFKAFNVPVAARDLKDNETVEKLEAFLSGDSGNEEVFLPRTEYGLTKTQEGIFAETTANPGTTIYNIPMLLVLPEGTDMPKLREALAAAVNAHPYVMTRLFLNDEGRIMARRDSNQVFAASEIGEIHCADIEDVKRDLVKPFDLTGERLFRIRLIHAEREYLFAEFHHIISDGASMSIFFDDVTAAYNGRMPEPEKYSGYEAALVEENLRSGSQYEDSKRYYTELFGACEPDSLPIGDVQGGGTGGSGSAVIRAGHADREKIACFCADSGITENAFYTAAFGYVIGKFTGESEALFTTIHNGRNDPRFENTISMFVHTIPVLCRLENTKVKDYIAAIGSQLLESMNHDVYSFAEISHDLGISSDLLFAWQGAIADERFLGEPVRSVDLDLDEPKAEIEFQVIPTEAGLNYEVSWSRSRYSEALIRSLAGVYDKVLEEMTQREELKEILFADDVDELDRFNATERGYERTDLVTLFRRAAENHPDNRAVLFGDSAYTYAQVDEITERIAGYLRKQGVGRGSVVSILIPRCEYMPIAALGVLKAGAAYQPLDPGYPTDRLAFMMKDADCSLLIADEGLLERVPEYQGPVLLTKCIPDLPACEKLTDHPAPEDLFILLYTSGSTGVPKGVMLEHGNLVNFCCWYRDYYRLDETCRVAAYASFGFDACMMDLYPALLTGACVCIVEEDIRLDLAAMEDWFNRTGITHAFMTTQVGRQFYSMTDTETLRWLSVGGEKLVPVAPGKGLPTLINGYGPTECTIFTTVMPVERLYDRVPIGKPLSNYKLYVVDEDMRRLPLFMPGELLVTGRGVGRGYLNRPDLTEKAFIRNPFTEDPDYARAYRTGDVVRLLPDGNIDFIGRHDSQVKVRGFRIELTEVEAVIRSFPGIRDTTVQAFEDESTGEKFIAAYVVSDSEVNVSAMNDFIRSQKPAYMVPAVTMQIDSIPLNQNQKVNRRALPKPELKPQGADAGSVAAAPLNMLEKEILAIAAEVVNTDDFGITERFGDLGLSSISAIRLALQIYKRFGVQLNARELVSDGCIQSVENAVLAKLLAGDGETPEAPAAETAAETGKVRSCRLSFTQQGVYTECQANPDTVQYNMPFVMSFPEGIGEKQLKAAVRKVVDAHPYILCHFVLNENSEIVQEPIPDFTLDIPVLEMTAEEFESHKAAFVRPFDLTKGPAVRFEIVRTDTLNLLMDMHHLIGDGASLDIFISQLCQALDGSEIEKEQYTYYDFVADEKITPEMDDFFSGIMAETEDATRLIPDVFEEGLPHTEKTVDVPTDFAMVKACAQSCGVTPAAVYLAACYLAYGRYVCEDTVAIATVSNGRSNLKLGDTMGMFVNTLPLVISLNHKEKTADFLRRVAKGFSDTIAHENYPFARIASKFDFRPAASYTYQIGVLSDYRTKYGEIKVDSLDLDIAKLPVGIYVSGTEDDARIQAVYDSSLYSEAMMRGLAESVENAVHGLLSCETLAEISLTGAEQWKTLDSYNKAWDLDYGKNDTAVTVFRRNAQTWPDKTAAVYRDKTYTYRQLDELTDRLAAKLYRRACEVTGKTDLAEEVAAILLHRDENVFILPLAAVKAGLAYEPLDPSYPKERLNFMVKDAGCCLLLAEDDLRDLVDEYQGPVLSVSDLYGMEDETALPEGPSPENLFVMLYTSGSTGTPKGCQIEHRNLVSYAHGVRNVFYTREDRIAAYASFGFDVNMSDVFCTLLNGGTVCLIPEEIRMDLGALAVYFDEAGITALLLTTQVGVQFLQNYPRLKTLRMLVMGGEKLPAVDPSKLSYTIVNGYGPTENCCGVSLFPIRAWEPNIPIGKPMSTIHGYVLDKTGHRLPAGAAGEYCLSGPQVSRGYLNRPEKTAEAYEACPFNEFRMYHTGDIVRYRQNGDVEFVGRKDGQVKIRGFRIETKEVESVIRGFAGIRDVTVQAYDYEGGGKYLAAFVVGDDPVDVQQLTDYIKTQKPAYMVPAAIMQIEKIPLTVNQKVDKKALPEPKLQKAAYVAPVGKTEEDFCAIFGSVLGLEHVSAEDDFFDVGGSSILAMKVVVAAEKAGYSIVYNDVFRCPTPRAMAEFLTGEKESAATVPADIPVETDVREIPEIGRDGYDYSGIHALLERNTLEAFRSGEHLPLNDVLLLGGTGYLGSHVLHELIVHHESRLFCFVRPGKGESGQERLKKVLRSYFGDDFALLFPSRITVIEGDATDPEALMAFRAPSENMTVINCAASVKHFARGNEIERANVDSVRNLAAWCLRSSARLVHISTGSVAGSRENGVPPVSFRFDEHRLYAGQVIDNNQYVHSKFMAERLIYEEMLEHGLRAKVFRMGNLAPRAEDGVFQINYKTNNYMNTFRAYQTLGMIPYDALDAIVEFSPIDCLARAVLALAGTPDDCVCFVPLNPHRPLMGDVVQALREEGHPIRGVEPEEFASAFRDALSDENMRDAVSCLAAYDSNDNTEAIGLESSDNSYTVHILGRLGFTWPETGTAYIRQFLNRLEEKEFFRGNDR